MKRYLLDTSVVIDFLRQADKKKSLLYQLSNQNCSISLITHTELYAGKSVWENKIARNELETLFSAFTIIAMDMSISKIAGSLKTSNQRASLIDCIIAATAIQHGLELVTLNIKDFIRFKDLILFNESSLLKAHSEH